MLPIGKEVVGIEDLCTATVVYEILVCCVLGALQPILTLLSALHSLFAETAQGHAQLVVGE